MKKIIISLFAIGLVVGLSSNASARLSSNSVVISKSNSVSNLTHSSRQTYRGPVTPYVPGPRVIRPNQRQAVKSSGFVRKQVKFRKRFHF